jgi:dolichyl-phosphate-mannose-protein mannosyltransferase
MATSNSAIRQRGGQKEKKQMNGKAEQAEEYLDTVIESSKKAVTSEWDYKLGLLVTTILSFVTRFWGISHPNEVVFDEVHFGKVRINTHLRAPH